MRKRQVPGMKRHAGEGPGGRPVSLGTLGACATGIRQPSQTCPRAFVKGTGASYDRAQPEGSNV